MKVRDFFERLLWTFVAGFFGGLLGAPVLIAIIEAMSSGSVQIDLAPLGYVVLAAAIGGLTDVANTVLIFARYRLSVLPNPGGGLPGLPVSQDPPGEQAA